MKTNYVYVLSKQGQPLMPTTRYSKVRKLLKNKKAKVVRSKPFTIQLLYDSNTYTQPLSLGIDPGRNNIGVSVTDSNNKELFSAELETRNKDISKLMINRKISRLAHRTYKRDKRKRRAIANNTNLKKNIKKIIPGTKKPIVWKTIRGKLSRFSNRKRSEGWLTPTANHLLKTHLNFIDFIYSILPITKIRVEYSSFDIHKMHNPKVKGIDYQKGKLYSYLNSKEYCLARDKFKCRLCNKKGILTCHHINQKKSNGNNRPDNLITLCVDCHNKVHKEKRYKKKLDKIISKLYLNNYADASILNIIMPSLFKTLKRKYKRVYKTYGYKTKFKRRKYKIKKTHNNDAFIISTLKKIKRKKRSIVYNFKQFRRHDKRILDAVRDRNYKDGKIVVAKNRNKRCDQTFPSLKEIREEYGQEYISSLTVISGIKRHRTFNSKFKPGDLIKFKGKRHVVVGSLNKGVYIRVLDLGSKNIKSTECKLIKSNSGIVCV